MTQAVAAPERPAAAWHGIGSEEALERLDAHVSGLEAGEVERRRAQYGPNKLAEAKQEPAWRSFLRQYRDLMQLVLLGAAIVSIVALQEFSTGIVIIALTVLNAVLGLNQEGKAAESVAALQKMLLIKAHVRRDGVKADIPAEELVPGDVATFEAGDKIPADGRLLVAATLEIEEAALTGESTPVLKSVDAVPGEDVPLGDRVDMAYMNSTVTRGRGEMVVTATGMETEVGRISGMLAQVEQEKTPLTRQLDQLTVLITVMAGVALALVVVIGLLRGDDFDEIFIIGISLAIAAIPTGLPAVVTTMLSLGTQALAAKGAIIKRIRSVETLGATSAICSDKTGTLTLNQMTARQLVVVGRRYAVEGEGYSTVGKILRTAGDTDTSLEPFLVPMALANDAAVRDGEIVGDPTEAALVVLAAKGGIDVDETRRVYPRVGEVPFDSEYKFMATFHRMQADDGRTVVRCFVKGAPDVLLARSSGIRDADGSTVAADGDARAVVLAENDRLASEGLRVLAVGSRDIAQADFDPGATLLDQVQGLTLLGLVGIVDPPRTEARDAIARCKESGIRVRMITGDHATTAAAIARQLGIEGRALSGTEFAALSDAELEEQVGDIGVVARVAPEDKVRLVDMLKGTGNVVAMTGDGVNDAPALKRSDIGVAMGITGTEVTKEAADMILTDDNFATIVTAVEGGRGIYDNLMKYVRVQLVMLGGFILTFVGAAIFDVAGGAPLTPLQILWINFAVDVLLAIGLGFDAAAPGLMRRKPRDAAAPVVDRALAIRLGAASVVMAALTLGIVAWGENRYDLVVATTMGLTTLSLMHIVAALEAREPTGTIFSRYTIANRRFVQLIGAALVLSLLVTTLSPLQRIFDTVELTSAQWGVCLLGPLVFLAFAELGKLVDRRIGHGGATAVPVAADSPA
jgi:Ca2+-transporting ATPase